MDYTARGILLTPKRWRAIYRVLLIAVFLFVGIYVGDIPVPGYVFDLPEQYISFFRYSIGILFLGCAAIKLYAHRVYKCPFCGNSLDFRPGWGLLRLINAAIAFLRFINIKHCVTCNADLTDPDIEWNDK